MYLNIKPYCIFDKKKKTGFVFCFSYYLDPQLTILMHYYQERMKNKVKQNLHITLITNTHQPRSESSIRVFKVSGD